MSEPMSETVNQETTIESKPQLKLEEADRNSKQELTVKQLLENNEENREKSITYLINIFSKQIDSGKNKYFT